MEIRLKSKKTYACSTDELGNVEYGPLILEEHFLPDGKKEYEILYQEDDFKDSDQLLEEKYIK